MEYSQEELIATMNSTREGSVWDVLDIKLVEAEKERVVAAALLIIIHGAVLISQKLQRVLLK